MNNTIKSTSKTSVSEEHISFLWMCDFNSCNTNITVLNSPHTYGCSNSCGIFRFLRIQWMVNISFMSTKLDEKIRHQTSTHIHNNISHNEAIILFQNNINVLQDFRPSQKCWWRLKYSAMLCSTDWYKVTDVSKGHRYQDQSHYTVLHIPLGQCQVFSTHILIG
jgi:hypothetical protein